MKDFYDIYLLSDIYSFDGKILKEAIASTLERRGTVLKKENKVFTEEFVQNKIKQWNAYLDRIGQEPIPFREVIFRIKMFLLPICKSILQGENFWNKWDNDKGEWGNTG